jgi:hypothetical protein
VFVASQILTVLIVAVAMAMGLAHALELPGKRRRPKETYLAVQPIYYPGFTVGGMVGEFGGMLTTLILLLITPPSTTSFGGGWIVYPPAFQMALSKVFGM